MRSFLSRVDWWDLHIRVLNIRKREALKKGEDPSVLCRHLVRARKNLYNARRYRRLRKKGKQPGNVDLSRKSK